MIRFLILIQCIMNAYSSFVPSSPFNEWFAIDFVQNIDKSKPYAFNVGELPLVAWFPDRKQEMPLTTINICRHMGSRLDHGYIEDSSLVCPYHGLKHSCKQAFGKTMIFQDKLWWSYSPVKANPPAIPFYKHKKFETSFIKIDVDANIIDCALNTMDINHPAFVHNNVLGFGSDVPPQNISMIKYPDKNKVGLTFSYTSQSKLNLAKKYNIAKSFHIYDYPYNTWSSVLLPTKEFHILNVNLLPLAPNKTRWLVTLKHNFWNKDEVQKHLMKFSAHCILNQDKYQLDRQAPESPLKRAMMYQVKLANDEYLGDIRALFKTYKYPDEKSALELLQNTI